MPFQDDPKPPPPRDRMEMKGEAPHSDQWWDMSPIRKVDHLQVFSRRGEEIYSSFWRPSGNYRVRIGWFGRVTVEQEFVFVDHDAGIPGSPSDWRRAPRGTVIKIMGGRRG